MILLTRIILGALGLIMLFMGVQYWFDPLTAAGAYGVTAKGVAGAALLRADIGGFFLSAGAFALLATVPLRRFWLWPMLILFGCALAGRIITLAVSGVGEDGFTAIIVETVAIVLTVLALRSWPRP